MYFSSDDIQIIGIILWKFLFLLFSIKLYFDKYYRMRKYSATHYFLLEMTSCGKCEELNEVSSKQGAL